MKLQMADVQHALAKLLNHYPESGHNATSIGKLAFDWLDLLSEEGVTQKQFSAGVRYAVKTCSFFPKVSDILKGVSAYRERPPQEKKDTLFIADTTSRHDMTNEEIARNKARISHIVAMLSGRISMEEAVSAVEKNNHIAEFNHD